MTPTASFPYSAAASSTRVGIKFCACYFKPDSGLYDTAVQLYVQNVICCYRQWYYSAGIKKSVDMVLTVNGIQAFAFELKNQYTGQTVENAERQWMYDRDLLPVQ